MMEVQSNQFIQLSSIAITDMEVRAAVTYGTRGATGRRMRAMTEISEGHGEAIRQQAAACKRHALNNLADLLETAEARMKANGITVLWAADAAEARRHVLDITGRHGTRRVIKSKSMVTEEIALNDALEAAGIETVETDLGEYILQLNHEPPSHIVAPVVHKSKASVRQILEREMHMPPTDDTAEMVRHAREHLRPVFLAADMGISGGNFIVAETGSICLVTNEGNGRLTTTLPPVHVALVGIEKIVATVEDYATLTQILPRHASGQKLAVYTQMINGPRRPGESDGPQHVYVILVDNGRSTIYTSGYTEALACLRCGACLNACPVYEVVNGHSYGWVYQGPIGAIITPLLTGLENASPLPYASTLCGRCKQVCPVDIDMPRMLLDLRHDLVEMGQSDAIWDWGMTAWAFGFRSPGRYQLGGKLAGWAATILPGAGLPGPLKGWTKYRPRPAFAKKSFRTLWAEHVRQRRQD
jgi:L-lactate dehydrogenase complex protein LldF